ncbi:kinase-like protein [Gigaspora margarita]|uniref:Kinase-like protein n=1 Tax=Gigaspora margarita TaxID=4874 RepID=A0A8H4EM78_GIGMA|nr:kinase-like protein [Gigaspora margarita]
METNGYSESDAKNEHESDSEAESGAAIQGEKKLPEYLEHLEKYLKKVEITNFDYSLFGNLKFIGSGASADVYFTTYKNNKYALKCLHNNLCFNNKTFKKFIRELDCVRQMDHNNIVKFFGITTCETNFMMVLQFANGGNLRDFLKTKQNNGLYKISWTELTTIAIEITGGLAYLHSKNIIHRDLHSKNVLVDDGKALIADFGIAKQLNDSISFSSTIAGMPAYTDPRYLQHGDIDKKVDIYSLGVLLWELTSGIPPFNSHPHIAVILEVLQDKRERTIPNTPSSYADLYMRCWSSDPTQRPTLDSILTKLKKFSTETSIKYMINNIVLDSHLSSDYSQNSAMLELIEKTISDGYINYLEYNNFTDPIEIDVGGFGKGFKHEWKDSESTVVLKCLNVDTSLNEKNIKDFINELKLLHDHPNIITIYGVTKDNNGYYNVVLQYANEGTLQEYLKINLNQSQWTDKLRIAEEISSGLLFLHNNNIIHRNLHSKNILIHQRQAKIAYFGLLNQINQMSTASNSIIHEMPTYMEPKCLIDHKYKRDKKSDVYSFGIILWEISSGRPPFQNFESRDSLVIHIFQGTREEPIEGTPPQNFE